MKIEQFIAQSEGEWISMRSGHSLAFKQFEQVVSTIKIEILSKQDQEVINLIEKSEDIVAKINGYTCPFRIKWNSISDWEEDNTIESPSGSSILIPIPKTNNEGLILRSRGYAETTEVASSYEILDNGMFMMISKYSQSISEERIWFLSENVRCRSSAVKTSKGSGILQTSYASEIRKVTHKK